MNSSISYAFNPLCNASNDGVSAEPEDDMDMFEYHVEDLLGKMSNDLLRIFTEVVDGIPGLFTDLVNLRSRERVIYKCPSGALPH